MKVSMSWLNEWVDVADLDPLELAERLTMVGLEVDGIEYVGRGHDDIVVGRILSIDEHPNADRLVICEVDVGDGDSPSTIVCGASNMKAGDRVPVALPGSNPPGIDFSIDAREVMGVESHGMLCSGEELELDDASDGLLILGEGLEVGEPVFEALDICDDIIEIDLTPNRADCLSHRGVAREVAALYDRPIRNKRLQDGHSFEGAEQAVAGAAELTVSDSEGCPHYRMAVLEGVETVASPQWLQQRLRSVGVRPINYVVDVTNFVLMDIGQPLHAFDLDCLEGPEIVVRRAKKGEKLLGIDHQEYELSGDDLVIADGQRPVALAGVMGGADSEVTESTSRILLECAYFDPTTVRKASKRHGLHTESSHRFERGIDEGALAQALERAVELLCSAQQEATGSGPEVCPTIGVAGGDVLTPQTVRLDPQRAAAILGIHIDGQQCREYLESIGLEVKEEAHELLCSVPTFRGDLERPIDLVEEVARLYGYDQIPATLPRMVVGEPHRLQADKEETIVSREERANLAWVRDLLLDQGILEAINYSFMGEADFDRLRLAEDDCRRMAPRVANPLVQSQAYMRTTLVPSLLDNLQTNFAQRRHDLALFEMGRRYFTTGEVRTLAIAVTGRRQHHWSGDRDWDFFDLKGIVAALAAAWDIDGAQWHRPKAPEPYLHPGVQAVWKSKDQVLGFVGQIHPALAQDEKIEQPVFVAEIDLEALVSAGRRQPTVTAAPKYPEVVRDFALLYDQDRPFGELRDAVGSLAREDESFGAIFEALELFDVYEGEQVPAGRRSLAIKVTYRSSEETLKEAQVEIADRQLLSHLEATVDAQLR